MIKEILSKHEESMNKAIDVLRREFSSLRAGRATPNLLDKVMVPYYGTPTSVNQLAKVTVPEPHMIVITPWEKEILHDIEIAISKSDLGLSPNSDGTVIRLAVPQPTQERRKELIKTVGKKTEEAKVALRNIRRDANEAIKKLEKDKEINEDESKRGQDSVQKLPGTRLKRKGSLMRRRRRILHAISFPLTKQNSMLSECASTAENARLRSYPLRCAVRRSPHMKRTFLLSGRDPFRQTPEGCFGRISERCRCRGGRKG